MRYDTVLAAATALAIVLVAPSVHGRPASRPLAEIPLEFEKNLPLATVRVNGSPLTLILDTAADGCLLDEAAAASAGIVASRSAISSGSGGRAAVKLTDRVRLRVADVDITVDYAVVTSLTGLKFTKAVHGVLGSPLFARYVVELDYPRSAARIYRPADYRPPAGGHVLAAWMTHGPTVRGRLKLPGQETIDADFQVDTGSSHVLTICTPFVTRHRMLDKVPDLKAQATLGVGGSSPDMVGRIDSVSVGPFSIENPEVRFSTHSSGSFATDLFSGNLGNGFLNRYTVIFDMPHSRLIVKP